MKGINQYTSNNWFLVREDGAPFITFLLKIPICTLYETLFYNSSSFNSLISERLLGGKEKKRVRGNYLKSQTLTHRKINK